MTYLKTNWSESGMTEANKVISLNNLETQYDNMASELGSLTHSSSYYTKTESNAKYFTASTDGEGSGLVAETVDGYTYSAIMNAGIPSGVIAMWFDTIVNIPTGWHLCDGTDGTPDLRNRFIIGAGDDYVLGATGGTSTVTTAASASIASHVLTIAEMASHNHEITEHGTQTSFTYYSGTYSAPANSITTETGVDTDARGGGLGHVHNASFTGTVDQEKRPPFFALYFIMRL